MTFESSNGNSQINLIYVNLTVEDQNTVLAALLDSDRIQLTFNDGINQINKTCSKDKFIEYSNEFLGLSRINITVQRVFNIF